MLILITSEKRRAHCKAGATLEAKTWDPSPKSVTGFYGYAWGTGPVDSFKYTLMGNPVNAIGSTKWWCIVEVSDECVMNSRGLVRYHKGIVKLATKNLDKAIAYLEKNGAADKAVMFSKKVGGDYEKIMVGSYGTATTGECGSAIAGDYGTATAGLYGNASADNYGTANAGYHGIATAGHYGTATAGSSGNAIAGYKGIATAGFQGNATAHKCGKAKVGYGGVANTHNEGVSVAGDGGIAISGSEGTAIAGDGGIAIVGMSGSACTGKGGTIIFHNWTSGKVVTFHEGTDYKANKMYQRIYNSKKLKEIPWPECLKDF